MGKKILCIDIGPVTTYVAETDYKAKTAKIYQAFQMPTPDGVVVDGSIQQNPEFIGFLKSALDRHKIRTKSVLFVVNSVRVANRQVRIPALKDNKIHDFLMANATEYFPVDLTQYQLIYNVLERDKKELTLSVLAMPNDLISSYQNLAKAMGLQLEALDYIGNSVAQAMLRMHEEPVRVNLDIHEIQSMLTIMQGQRVVLQRNITYGVQEAVQTVMDSGLFGRELSYEAVMDIMRQKTLMFRRFNDEAPEETEAIDNVDREKLISLREEVTESLRMLVGNISRNLDYFVSRNEGITLSTIWVTGPGADVSGMTKLLSTELNLKCRTLQRVASVNVPKTLADENFRIGEYLHLVASATNPTPISLGGKKGASGKAEGGNDSLLVPAVFFGVCAIAAIGMLVYFKMSVFNLEKQKQTLQTQIAALGNAKTVAANHEAVGVDYAQVKLMDMYTKTGSDNILPFLEELERKIPTEGLVTNLTTNANGITMEVNVATKAALSELLVQLRQFDMLQNITTTGFSEKREENGIVVITCTITAEYRIFSSVEEETPDGAADGQNTDTENSGEEGGTGE